MNKRTSRKLRKLFVHTQDLTCICLNQNQVPSGGYVSFPGWGAKLKFSHFPKKTDKKPLN